MRPRSHGSGEPTDVLVIGAGASGAVAARHLAERGLRVVCLEQGHWPDPSAYTSDRVEWELSLTRRWHTNPNVRQLDEDYPCEVTDSEIAPLMYSGVGGSTIHYSAQWLRLTPSDFRFRSTFGLGDDWPITYEELAPFYDEVQADFGVSGLPGDPAFPAHELPLPATPIGRAGRVMAEGMNRLGWHWWPGTHAIPSEPWRRQQPCVRRGTCGSGCPEGAKGSTDVTHWPDAIARGARLVTGARVRELTIDRRGLATGAIWIDRDGREHWQRADVTMLAANGIGTPRLLLLSRSARFPDGLANRSGLVGRRLMMHPLVAVLGIYDEPLDPWLGPLGSAIYSMQFYETDLARGFPGGGKWDLCPVGGPLGLLARHAHLPPEQRAGLALHELLRRCVGHAMEWGVTLNDLPSLDNRVALDPELTDSDGVSAPRITYRESEPTRAQRAFHRARVIEAHVAAGAHQTIDVDLGRDTGWHLLGTCRMGISPDDSVVRPDGRSHDVPNLYVVDGSVFVSAGGVNPTATIAALALRTASLMVAGRRAQKVPA